MKVEIIDHYEGEEKAVFYIKDITTEIEGIIARIHAIGESIQVENFEGNSVALPLEEIYYLETVENQVYVYLGKGEPLFIPGQRLVEVETELEKYGFVRISKTVIVHVEKLLKFYPAGAGKQKAVLENGEEVIVSRRYSAQVLQTLKRMEEME